MKRLLLISIAVLLLSNAIWAWEYRALWYDDAQTDGLLDQANHYARNGCKN